MNERSLKLAKEIIGSTTSDDVKSTMKSLLKDNPIPIGAPVVNGIPTVEIID